jgi:membrane dipeptidase
MSIPAPLWDQHTCLALDPGTDVGELNRFARPGGAFTSVNVGYSLHSAADVLALLDGFRAQVASDPGLALALTPDDVRSVIASGQIAVAFDLEDSGPLEGDLDRLQVFADLGVRTMLPSYNRANAAGCGCLDAEDTGLTAWGRSLVRQMNAVGVVPDGSHCSVRTGLDMCAISAKPVIYSHSCMRSVWDHPRNITDEQARECAATGGVIGITGVGIFLGPNRPTTDAMVRHIEAAVELVGIDHVGVSSDFSFDGDDFNLAIASTPELFDESYTRWGPVQWMEPEVFVTIGATLSTRGWDDDAVAAVLGGNFLRVAEASWPR